MPYLLVGKRAKDMAAVAAESRLDYLENDEPYGLTRKTFSLFVQSDRRPAENVLAGRWQGHEMYGFDYPYLSSRRRDLASLPPGLPALRYESGIQYGCVLVPTDGDLPFVHIGPRSMRKGFLPTGMETPIPVGNQRLRKQFRMWAEDPEFLRELLTPDVVAFLLRTEGRFTFELHEDAMLCLDRSVLPIEMPPLMGLVVNFKATIPAQIWRDHPRRSGPENDPPPSPVTEF